MKSALNSVLFAGALALTSSAFAWDSDWAGDPYFGNSPSVASYSNADAELAKLPACSEAQVRHGKFREYNGTYYIENYAGHWVCVYVE